MTTSRKGSRKEKTPPRERQGNHRMLNDIN